MTTYHEVLFTLIKGQSVYLNIDLIFSLLSGSAKIFDQVVKWLKFKYIVSNLRSKNWAIVAQEGQLVV